MSLLANRPKLIIGNINNNFIDITKTSLVFQWAIITKKMTSTVFTVAFFRGSNLRWKGFYLGGCGTPALNRVPGR